MPAPVGSGRLHAEHGLAELDGLAVLDEDLGDRARKAGGDVRENLHSFDDADDGLGGRRWAPTETNAGELGALDA